MGREKRKNPSGEKTKPREGTDESIGSLGPNDQRPSLALHTVPAVGDGVGRGRPRGRGDGCPPAGSLLREKWRMGSGNRWKAGEVVRGWIFQAPCPCSSGLLLWLAPQIPMSTAKSVDFVDVVVDVDSIRSARNRVEAQVQLEERRCTR